MQISYIPPLQLGLAPAPSSKHEIPTTYFVDVHRLAELGGGCLLLR